MNPDTRDTVQLSVPVRAELRRRLKAAAATRGKLLREIVDTAAREWLAREETRKTT